MVRLYACLLLLLAVCGGNNAAAASASSLPVVLRWHIDLSHPQGQSIAVWLEVSDKLPLETAHLRFLTAGFGGYKGSGAAVQRLQATDRQGNLLPISPLSANSYRIEQAGRMLRLQYYITMPPPVVGQYSASASCWDLPRFAMLQAASTWAYIESLEQLPNEVYIHKPRAMVGSAGLDCVALNDTTDLYKAVDFEALYESTLLYSTTDTLSFRVRNCQFAVRYASLTAAAGSGIDSRELYNWLQPVAVAVGNMLGTFPTQYYTFQVVMMGGSIGSSDTSVQATPHYGGRLAGSAALMVLPNERNKTRLRQRVQRMATHELLHLLLPYTLRSQHTPAIVHNQADTSPHVWLYEGATEYLTHLCLLRSGLINEEQFWNEIARKIYQADQYPALSLWQLSKHVTRPKYAQQYSRVYSQGALTAMALDTELHQLSNGQQHLIDLLQQLAQQYQRQRFDDQQFMTDLVRLSHPQIATFWQQYVQAKHPPSANTCLAVWGKQYHSLLRQVVGRYGAFGWQPDYKSGLMRAVRVANNDWGLRNGDYLTHLNQQAITTGNYALYQSLLFDPPPAQTITITVQRNQQTLQLRTTAQVYRLTRKNTIADLPTYTPFAQSLRTYLRGK